MTAIQKLEWGVCAFRHILRGYKQTAKRKGRVFELTDEDFIFLTQMNCYYCGAEPYQISTRKGSKRYFKYNGIDRVDSGVGYVMSNIVPCCGVCNTMKNNLTIAEFRDHLRRIMRRRRW